jgi:nicotinate-nucleotide adenylyltransferase
MNIALFGTSADPPTIGHAAILQTLAAQFDHVAVWAANNPFKSEQTPLTVRHQMLALLIQELGGANVALHPELSDPRTWHTLERAKTIWPEANFTLVVGADLVPQLPRWYRAAELLAQVRLLIMPRRGYPIAPADRERLEAMVIGLQVATLTPPKVSSSEYREQGAHHPETLLTPGIQSYIDREQLYRCPVHTH